MVTYFVVIIFLAMMAYLVKYVVVDSETTIANSYNKRQSIYAETVTKGQILSSDGKVLAETVTDSEGNETRNYPYGTLFAHVVGYATSGQSGLEMSANYYLLTSNQNILARVYHSITGAKDEGNNVVTTLDYTLQKAAYDALGSNDGAVIVIEPSTGKIRAMVSKPDYDPNEIADVIANSDSSSSVLLNRVTQGLYAPGSTFKILTSLEYIRENVAYNNYSYDCQSQGIFNSVSIHCYGNKTHGTLTLKQSLAYSCNTSFANIGTTLNVASFAELCETFLYNSELPYDGYYNKSSFKLTADSDKSDIAQTVIGQGDTLITPLHNALIMCAIANGGVLMKPYLIERIESTEGTTVKKFANTTYGRIISATEATELIDLLSAVTEYGTASSYFSGATYSVAGKTGTAEYNDAGDSHSWFVGFSNVDNPDIVVCVLIEGASITGSSASAAARKIFDAYYENQ